ncbi:MAG: glucuronate isomerase [Cyclobacteriaceae bacterium]|nr:glucuronate isomerase [Cyclobacteriaceae bacterium]
MKVFLDKNFILQTETARRLYFEHAADLPIIDYHCHLPPEDVAADRKFENMSQIWLAGDHYKWRAMRTNGIDEKYITGHADDYEKFEKWAETVPYTLRNPLYHWTHMELKRPFGIKKILNPESSRDIYNESTALLQQDDFSARNIMRKFKVEVVCTTDDPADSLEHHKKVKEDGFEIKMYPTFRADKVLNIDNTTDFNAYLDRLGASADVNISNLADVKEALQKRHDYFAKMGCRLSDHGLETVYAEDFTEDEVMKAFELARSGKGVTIEQALKYKSAMLIYLAELDHSKGWAQQFHLGGIRNNSTRMMRQLGPDTGFDSMGDFSMARSLSKFFDSLDINDKLAKTVLYNLNPRDNELFATMCGNFNDGSIVGKMQFGSGWWFLDQKDGMELQMNALSNMGLLSHFVGMLTDSRSFLSYPRHDYFRRILCNLLGNDVENGLLPDDMDLLGQMVENISYYNAKKYFGF